MRHQRPRLGAWAALLLLSLGLAAFRPAPAVHAGQDDVATARVTRLVMGTLFEIDVVAADEATARSAGMAALDEVERVDRLLSHYKPDSELSVMNRSAAGAPFRASDELFAFLVACRRYVALTDGTFDPTVGPLVRAWGFIGGQPARPAPAVEAAAQARVGFGKVTLDDAAQTVRYAVPGMEFDPGGIGKGYAVDRAVAVLRAHRARAALVSGGGSTLYGLGAPPGRGGWRVAVRNPDKTGAPLGVVTLADAALSTSGVSEKSAIIEGRRVSHLFDPRTLTPSDGMCQVTVVAADATASDALTKAAFLLSGDAVTRLFAAQPGTHVLRVEGPCEPDARVWVTPWSRGIFAPQR